MERIYTDEESGGPSDIGLAGSAPAVSPWSVNRQASLELPPATPVSGLDEYRGMLAALRQKAPRGPRMTSAETMKALREGEED